MDAKSGELKNESKSKLFSAPDDAQESANGTTTNALEMWLMVEFKVHLIMHLELDLKVPFKVDIKMHKRVHLRMH